MSVKIDRLSSTYEKTISMILQQVKDQKLKQVTITGCEVTNDLSFAKVYYTIFDMDMKKEIKESLERNKSYIRGELSKKVNVRHTPELRFIFDESIEYGNKIERLLNNIKEQ